jgi:mRNA-degrading endonuclease RelE of RelBE toxin-antitoxin system
VSRKLFLLRVPPNLASRIGGLHPHIKKRVRFALGRILADPSQGKPLKQDLAGLWTFRVGRLRIVYRIAPGRIVEWVALGPRQSIDEETQRLLARRARPSP